MRDDNNFEPFDLVYKVEIAVTDVNQDTNVKAATIKGRKGVTSKPVVFANAIMNHHKRTLGTCRFFDVVCYFAKRVLQIKTLTFNLANI